MENTYNISEICNILAIEKNVSEKIGKNRWRVKRTFTMHSERFNKSVTVEKGFVHDRYSSFFNLSTELPAVCHDHLYKFKKWDDGTVVTKLEADLFFYDLIKKSPKWSDRILAPLYYSGVAVFGVFSWYKKRKV